MNNLEKVLLLIQSENENKQEALKLLNTAMKSDYHAKALISQAIEQLNKVESL